MEDRFRDVRAALAAGDTTAAQHMLGQAVQRNPYDGEAWYMLSTLAADPAQRADYLGRAQAAGYVPGGFQGQPGYGQTPASGSPGGYGGQPGYGAGPGQPGYGQPGYGPSPTSGPPPRQVDSWVQQPTIKTSSNLLPLLIIGGLLLLLIAGGIYLYTTGALGGKTASQATAGLQITPILGGGLVTKTPRPTATEGTGGATGKPGGIQAIEGDPAVIGEFFPNEGQSHTTEGNDIDYGTEPPTSGTHWGRWSAWGDQSASSPPDEMLVHNMEHGGVIIYFDPEKVTADEQQGLSDLVGELSQINERILLTKRPGMETPIALTSWQYRLLLDSVDLEKVRGFFNAHIARGPECVDGRCP